MNNIFTTREKLFSWREGSFAQQELERIRNNFEIVEEIKGREDSAYGGWTVYLKWLEPVDMNAFDPIQDLETYDEDKEEQW